MVTLDEAQVWTIGDQELSTTQESGQHNIFASVFKFCVVPNTFI